MHFSTAFNIVLLGVATVVSSLPISQSTSSLELESRDDFRVDVPDIFERYFDEPTLYRRAGPTKYNIALHQSAVGTPNEHWAVHIHPENSHASATWHAVHAVSSGKQGNGVLETEHVPKGGQGQGYDASRQGPHHMILGSVTGAANAKNLAQSLTGLKCQKKFPTENCVDWTKQAVDHLHASGHISAADHAKFTNHYNAHQATVRSNTATAANIKNAGHK